VLAFDRDFRLIVSSANLTMSGFHQNLEAFWMASTERGDRFGAAARDVMDFLVRLWRRHWSKSRALSLTITELSRRVPRGNGEARVLHTESSTLLLNQWMAHISGRPEELHIVSPYFNRGVRWRPIERFRGAQIHLYVLEKRVEGNSCYRLPVSRGALRRIRPTCRVIRPEWVSSGKGEEGEPPQRTVHAKCYATRSKGQGCMLLGSPNFTAEAFLGKNTEAAVLLKGPWRNIRRFLPPTTPASLDWKLITCSSPSEERIGYGWTPFLVTAEYNAGAKTIDLLFVERPCVQKWSVTYEGTPLGFGRRFPNRLRGPMRLGKTAFLALREGRHTAKFPFSVTEKELLPMVPEQGELDYEYILEILANGVENLSKLVERIRKGSRPQRGAEIETDRIPQMEWLRRLTRALEGLKKRLEIPLHSKGEAKALFRGDIGILRVIKGIRQDKRIDATLRSFAFLELGALLDSIRWSGEKEARQEAQRNVVRAQRMVRRWTKGRLSVSDDYLRHGRQAWSRG